MVWACQENGARKITKTDSGEEGERKEMQGKARYRWKYQDRIEIQKKWSKLDRSGRRRDMDGGY